MGAMRLDERDVMTGELSTRSHRSVMFLTAREWRANIRAWGSGVSLRRLLTCRFCHISAPLRG